MSDMRFTSKASAPGKVIRKVTETDKEGFTRSAMGYVENWRRFKAGLAPDTRNL